MVKIRLKRMGAHKKPFYRVVVADSRSPRDGKFIEEIGYYNPLTDPADIKIDAEKAKKWLDNGAQATDTVKSLLKKAGVFDAVATKQKTAKTKAVSEEVEAVSEEVEAVSEEVEAVSEEVTEPTVDSAETTDSATEE